MKFTVVKEFILGGIAEGMSGPAVQVRGDVFFRRTDGMN